jgi:hypothetical protein
MDLTKARSILFFVPVFGLISCMSEQNTVRDDFRLPPPHLRLPTPGSPTHPLREGVPIPANRDVVFPDRSGREFDGVRLGVSSVCSPARHPNIREQVHFEVRNTNSFPLKSAMPPSLWKRLELEQTQLVQCELTVRARNRHGSSHQGTLRVLISELNSLENLFIDPTGPDQRQQSHVQSVDVNSIREQWPKEMFLVDRDSMTELICDGYRKQLRLSTVENLPQVLWLLMSAPTAGPDDFRASRPLQKCRLFIEHHDSSHDAPKSWISPTFEARFTPVENTIAGKADLSQAGSGKRQLDGSTLFVFRIRNPSSFPTAYKLTNVGPNAVLLRHLMGRVRDSRFTETFSFKASIAYEFSGGSVHAAKDHFLIVLKAKDEITVTARLRTSFNCLWQFVHGPHAFAGGALGFMGFVYELEQPQLLLRYYQWDPEQPDPDGETYDVTKNITGRSALSKVPGWLPSAGWRDAHGPEPESIIRLPSNASLRERQCGTRHEIMLFHFSRTTTPGTRL